MAWSSLVAEAPTESDVPPGMPRIVLKEIETDKTLSVSDNVATIGRDPTSAFVIEGPNSKVVSARHARIFFQDNAWWIEDYSRNGTILDDERLQQGQRHAIRPGQLIGLGESGPRYRVMTLESRRVVDSMMEGSGAAAESAAEAAAPPMRVAAGTTRRPESVVAAERMEESTEPMSPAPDWLVQVTLRATATNQHYEVRAQSVRIGRSPECNVQIPPEQGASVSRTHAEIAVHDGGVVVRDLGSRNGTFVNGKRIDSPQTAARGTLIMLGTGGPTFSIEDLHIVKGQAPPPPESETTPAEAKPIQREEPPTIPKPIADSAPPEKVVASVGPSVPRNRSAAARGTLFQNVSGELSRQSARRLRLMMWSGALTLVIVAAVVLVMSQRRVAQIERRLAADSARVEARADSTRQAAAAEAVRLRDVIDSARASGAPPAELDSLRAAMAAAVRRSGAPIP